MTTTTMEAMSDGVLDMLRRAVAVLWSDEDAEQQRVIARVRVVFAQFEALRRAPTQVAFEQAFDVLATRRFMLQTLTLVVDPAFQAIATKPLARDLRPHEVRSRYAEELAADLRERLQLLLRACGAEPPSRPIRIDDVRKSLNRQLDDDVARGLAANIALIMAAHGDDSWPDWMVGMLWNIGNRSVLALAQHAGLPWGTAVDSLVTARDRRLAGMPFDQAESDRAKRLLGLQ